MRQQALACAAAALLACPAPDHPSYTRVEGAAPPAIVPSGAVLVVFWATWCPPCLDELPGLRALARDLPDGLALETYGEDEADAAVRAFFGGPPPPELRYRHDAGGVVAAALGVEALPAAFVVVDGRLVARFLGPRDWDSRGMRRLLARLASERPRDSGEAPGRR